MKDLLEPDTDYAAAVVSSDDLGVVHWMQLDHVSDVEIVLTGRNFDATRFRGQLQVRTERTGPDLAAEVFSLKVEWTRELARHDGAE